MADQQRRASNTTASNSNPSTNTRPLLNRSLRQPSIQLGSSLPAPSHFVTGPPTRTHWKPDTSAPTCESCSTRFTLLTRRHHCRTCGGIFCGPCSKFVVRLDQNAEVHPAGVESRVCADCWAEFGRRAEALRVQVNSAGASASASTSMSMSEGGVDGTKRTAQDLDGARKDAEGDKEEEEEDEDDDEFDESAVAAGPGRAFGSDRRASVDELPIAQSVPSDWSWSTF
ncbi:hypothetical protein HDU79_008640 [Rhizoclosmatium sp. JEL0117]|nr:hypothetical protein HDU79_008640 [Rhizoclosmatium sp. JEL0117]